MNPCLIAFFVAGWLHPVVEKTKHGVNGQKFDNLVWILIGTLIGTKNRSQISFFLSYFLRN